MKNNRKVITPGHLYLNEICSSSEDRAYYDTPVARRAVPFVARGKRMRTPCGTITEPRNPPARVLL